MLYLRGHLPLAGPASKLLPPYAAHTPRQNGLATKNSLCSLGLPSFFLFPQSHVLCGNLILLEILQENWLRLLNLFFTPHFYMQASNVDVIFCTFGHLPCKMARLYLRGHLPPSGPRLEATATLRSPYSIHSHIFWKIRLRLLNIPLTFHSYKRASVVNVIGIFNR